MKYLLGALFAVLLSTNTLFAQQDNLQYPELKVKEDYAKSELLFQQVTDWLTDTDLDKQPDVRQKSSAFILSWLMGSPTVTFPVDKHTVDLFTDNPNLLMIYAANYGNYCISNKEDKSFVAPAKAGLQAVVEVYKKGIAITHTALLQALVKAADANKLDDYITKNMKGEIKAKG
ncbi:hypothetical protein ACE38W_15685 [Chitinophaga sp. Hz27]|uniref:hypothetical protein n=1 Tax=Chitinophaga sp. Hz27 TaxID=3347169 RepID=UPI0035DE0BCE